MKCIAASPHSRAASVQPRGTPSPCVERSEELSRSSRRAQACSRPIQRVASAMYVEAPRPCTAQQPTPCCAAAMPPSAPCRNSRTCAIASSRASAVERRGRVSTSNGVTRASARLALWVASASSAWSETRVILPSRGTRRSAATRAPRPRASARPARRRRARRERRRARCARERDDGGEGLVKDAGKLGCGERLCVQRQQQRAKHHHRRRCHCCPSCSCPPRAARFPDRRSAAAAALNLAQSSVIRRLISSSLRSRRRRGSSDGITRRPADAYLGHVGGGRQPQLLQHAAQARASARSDRPGSDARQLARRPHRALAHAYGP